MGLTLRLNGVRLEAPLSQDEAPAGLTYNGQLKSGVLM